MQDRSLHGFIEKVTWTLNTHRMLEPGEGVLVAVSGGPDSVCLLHLLSALSPALSIRLAVAHVNHGLRGKESDRDERFVARMAASLGWPFHLKRVAAQGPQARRASLEETAREIRYAFFREISRAHGYEKVALGHHAGDNAELCLMRLVTWSGPAGVSGIPPVRKDANGGGKIIRPLIQCTREEIESYLIHHGVAFVRDSTNASLRFLRNRIRHGLLPKLKSDFNPKIEAALNRFCAITAAEDQWLNALTESLYRSALIAETDDVCILSRRKVAQMPVAAQRRILRKAVKRVKGDLRRITFDHVETARSFLAREIGGEKRLCLPRGMVLRFTSKALEIRLSSEPSRHRGKRREKGPHRLKRLFQHRIDGPGAYRIPEIEKVLVVSCHGANSAGDIRRTDGHTAFFDAGRLAFPMTLRNWAEGDRFSPLGISGTQKVKKYFIDHKVPARDRAACPVLVSRGRIAWVVGHRIGHWARVTASTREVLRMELLLALPENNGYGCSVK